MTGYVASIAFSPVVAYAAWAGRPATRSENHSTPTWAFQIWSAVGSVRIAASAREPAITQAAAPLPVHSSSTTDCSSTGAHGERPSRRSAPIAPTIAARPAFMSPAPRPVSHSPSRDGSHGSTLHTDPGAAEPTSTWPLRISDRPPVPPGGTRATTLALPATSHENGDAAGDCRSASGSNDTSTGSS